MTRLLLLTYFFPPDSSSAATRPGQLFRYLPSFGYQPEVIANRAENTIPGEKSVLRVPDTVTPGRIAIAAAITRFLARFGAPYDDRLPWVPHAVAAAHNVMRANPAEAVYSTSPFLSAHVAAMWIKFRYGLPWLADLQDPIVDNPTATRRWFFPYYAVLEKLIFRYADHLIANTDTVADLWRRRYPQWADKISILWNSFDPAEKLESASLPERSYHLLAHIGDIYGGRHPSQLLASIERLIQAGQLDPASLRLLQVGAVTEEVLPRMQPLWDRMQQTGMLRVENERIPRPEALRRTMAADLLLLLDLNDTNSSLQVPAKLLDYIRAGRPILAFTLNQSPVERILAKTGISHVCISPDSSDEMVDEKVLHFLRAGHSTISPGDWFQENLNCVSQAKSVAELLDQLRSATRPSA